jgi:DNA-binding GntR family transcriptional regulator
MPNDKIEPTAMAKIFELSASERAYRGLRSKIVSLDLLPNQQIAETQLSESLGMSRTPVREALSRLANEGLVDFRSRAGTIVSPIRLEDVRAAHYVREKLEMAIVVDAAQIHNPKAIFDIQQCINVQRFAIEQQDYSTFYSSDEEMHRHYCVMIGMLPNWSVIADAKKHMDRVRMLSLQSTATSDLNQLLVDHIQIVDAVMSGDGEAAANVMQEHLSRVMLNLDNLVNCHSDYFEIPPPVSGDSARIEERQQA